MKKNLASMIIFSLFLLLDLSASTYKWSGFTDKETAYVNEAVLLTYICEFSDDSELYTIDFDPVQDNENLSIKLLKQSQALKDSKRVNIYKYIAYVKKAGPISFDFDVVMKQTTQDSVNSVIRGHYDDSNSESFISTPMKQAPLHVNIKDTLSKLVGKFTFNVTKDMPNITAYEPYHLEMQIKGVGNLFDLDSVDFTIDNVKMFTQGALLKTELTQNGEQSIWTQKFAFMSESSFVIPKVSIEYFNLETNRLESLTLNEINVNVDKPAYKKEDLLDTPEENLSYKLDYLYYLLTFLVGFFVAKIKFNTNKPQRTKDELFIKSIKETTSLEKLCFLLINKDTGKYKEIISKIESKELTSLKKAKNLIITGVKTSFKK